MSDFKFEIVRPFPSSSVMLYRHVVPGVVGTSGAANAEVMLREQTARQIFFTKLVRNINRTTTLEVVKGMGVSRGRAFDAGKHGGLETAAPCSMIRK